MSRSPAPASTSSVHWPGQIDDDDDVVVPMDPELWSNLPQDLGRTILEFAARSNWRTRRVLMLLSRDIHTWMNPIFYQGVYLSSPRSIVTFLHTISYSKTGVNPFWVKRLFVSSITAHMGPFWGSPTDDYRNPIIVGEILSKCTEIMHLAIWCQFLSPELANDLSVATELNPWMADLTSVINSLVHLTHFHYSFPPFTVAALAPTLSRITHLHTTKGDIDYQMLTQYTRSLTHLHLTLRECEDWGGSIKRTFEQAFVTMLARPRTLAVAFSGNNWHSCNPTPYTEAGLFPSCFDSISEDPRFVALLGDSTTSWMVGFGTDAPDMWHYIDKIVERHRNGESQL